MPGATDSTGSLFDLGDQDIAHHDLRHSSGELHNVIPHPVGRPFVGDERFIRAVKHADGDNHIWAAMAGFGRRRTLSSRQDMVGHHRVVGRIGPSYFGRVVAVCMLNKPVARDGIWVHTASLS